MKAYLRGKYGAAPGPVSREVIQRVLGGEEPIHVRPADLVHETLEDYRDEIGDLARSEEDLLSYALFPQTARAYLERHHIGPESDVFGTQMPAYLTSQVGAALGDDAGARLRDILALVEESDVDEVVIEQGDLKMTVRRTGVVAVAPAPAPAEAAAAPVSADDHADGYHMVRSKWVATFYRAPSPQALSFVEVGDLVAAGQTLCILEMMKMMNELTADVAGIVRQILVENGETVQYGQPLFAIEPV